MAATLTACPSCENRLRVEPRMIGKALRCGHCEQLFLISIGTSVPAPEPAENPEGVPVAAADLPPEVPYAKEYFGDGPPARPRGGGAPWWAFTLMTLAVCALAVALVLMPPPGERPPAAVAKADKPTPSIPKPRLAKPAEPIVIRRPAEPFPIGRAAFDGREQTLPLPGDPHDVLVAGGGRFLVMSIPQAGQVAVFDCTAAKVAGYLPLPAGDVAVAAGATKLYLILRGRRVAQEYDLKALKRLRTVALPVDVAAAAMGSAVDGPLCVVGDGGRLSLIDTADFHKLDIADPSPPAKTGRPAFSANRPRLRVSGDGRLIALAAADGTQTSFSLQGGKLTAAPRPQRGSQFAALPSADGDRLFAYGGTFAPDWTPLDRSARGVVPAAQGRMAVRPTQSGLPRSLPNYAGTQSTGDTLTLTDGDGRTLATLSGVRDYRFPRNDWAAGADRVVYVPQAQVLVTFPPDADKLTMRRADPLAESRRRGVDHLFAASLPVTHAGRGGTYKYRIAVASSKRIARFELLESPAGMTVAGDGAVSWAVPAGHPRASEPVAVRVTDAAGRHLTHRWNVAVSADAAGESGRRLIVDDVAATGGEPPAGPTRLTLRKSEFDGDMESIKLPQPIEDIGPAGGGRLLVMRLKGEKRLRVFDAVRAKFIRGLPLIDTRCLVAGGLDKLIVFYPHAGIWERWGLISFQKEVASASPLGQARPASLAMGHASRGPAVLTVHGGLPRLIDVMSLAESKYPAPPPNGPLGRIGTGPLRASADGRLVATYRSALRVAAGSLTFNVGDSGVPLAVPGPHGRFVYTGYQVRDAAMRKLFQPKGNYYESGYVPAVQGDVFLRVVTARRPGGKRLVNLEFHFPGTFEPFAVWEEFDGTFNHNDLRPSGTRPGLDRRYMLVLSAGVLIYIPEKRDEIRLHRFDVEALLRKSEANYFTVTPAGVQRAERGKIYNARVPARSRAGALRYKLEAGPAGMELSRDGRLEWAVPADFAEGRVSVAVSVRDAAGREKLTAFSVTVADESERVAEPADGDLSDG